MSNQESVNTHLRRENLLLRHRKLFSQLLQREASTLAFISITTSASLVMFVLLHQIPDFFAKQFLAIFGLAFTALGILFREITIFGVDSKDWENIRRIETELEVSPAESQAQSTVGRQEPSAWQWKSRAILIRTFSYFPLFIWLGYLLNYVPLIAYWIEFIDFFVFLWPSLIIILSVVTGYFFTRLEEGKRNESISTNDGSNIPLDDEE